MIKRIKYYLHLSSFFLNKKKFLSKIKSQNDDLESNFLQAFIQKIENKTFIEFGFHPFEFNTIHLMTSNFKGVLVDANKKNVFFMNILKFFHNYKIRAISTFLNKENIVEIVDDDFGIFSIDIDGNDYWLTKEILETNRNFELMIVEYNSTFLDKSITTPYDKNFNRHNKHESGWYHGASLMAFIKLFNQKDYALIKTTGGNNAFFIKRDSLNKYNFTEVEFKNAFEESKLRNLWSNKNAHQQFEVIKHLEYVTV
jgi:hypothetical protein